MHRINRGTRLGGCATFVIALALTSAPAFGQSADPAAQTADGGDTGGVEDIIVNAQRRAENIQDVSLTIQAITAEGLVRSGVNDVTRLELISPGVTFGRYGADAKISLRGSNSNNTFLDSSPAVGIFIDEVYRPRAAQQTRAFFDVSRLEILKGPQGTLYGRNTLSGAVNLYTNAPDPDAFAGGAIVSYQRFNTVRAEGFVNVPLTDNFAVRFAGLIERGDGWIQNLAGENLGNPDTVSFRGSMRWEPEAGTDITLRLTKVRERGNVTGLFALSGVCRNVTAQGLTDPFGTQQDCRNPRRGSLGSRRFDQLTRRQVLKDFVHEDRIDETNITLSGSAPLTENISFKGIVSYTDFDLNLGQDSDFSEVRVSADFLQEKVKSITSELQLNSEFDGPFNFTTGAYISQDEIKFVSGAIRFSADTGGAGGAANPRPLIPVTGFPGTSLRRLDPTGLVDGQINLGDPNLPGRPVIINGVNYGGGSSNNFQYLYTRSLGLFGQARLELFDGFRVVGGLRYSRDEKAAVNYGGAASSTTFRGPQFPLTIPTTIDGFATDKSLATSLVTRNYENFTYRGALEYDINDDVLLFAQVATGFLSGSLATAGNTTDDQKSINYEAGIKSRFFDNRVQVNASIFYTEYTNLITSFQRPNNSGGVDTISINGGDIEAKGAEALIEYRPTEEFRLTFGVSYLDAEFGTFSVLAPHQLVNGNPSNNGRFVSLSGIAPQYSPKWQITTVAAYDFNLGDAGKITPQVQFYYTSRYSTQTQLSFLDPAGNQPSFTKTDLRLAWTSADERFGVEAFVENVENEIVLQRVTYGGDGIEQSVVGHPRNYGVRLRGRF